MGKNGERALSIITSRGVIAAPVRDAATAARIGHYWRTVRRYVETGDAGPLAAFRGRRVRAGGRRYTLVTSTTVLDRLARAGEFDFGE